MSSEKLRRETSSLDISFVYDEEDNIFALEKPLPLGVRPQQFYGQICTLKIKDATPGPSGGVSWDYHYGTINYLNVQRDTWAYNGKHEISYVQVGVLFSDVVYHTDLWIYFDYYPDDEEGSRTYPWCTWVDRTTMDTVFVSRIGLTPTTDPQTGDVTYSGTCMIGMIGSISTDKLVRCCALSSIVNGTTSSIEASNKIICAYPKSKGRTSNIVLLLSSYWKYTPDKVVNPSVEIVRTDKEVDTYYMGYVKYPLNISFTVRAADVIPD